jgi:AraC-like DNA-binding protein
LRYVSKSADRQRPVRAASLRAAGGINVSENIPPKTLPTVAGFAIRCALAALQERDISVRKLFDRAGLSDLQFASPWRRISAAAQGDFLEYAAEATGDTAFGLHLAERSNPRDAGLLYYVATAARDLGEALALFARYFLILNESVRFKLVRSPASVMVEFNFIGVSQDRVKQNTEFWLGLIVHTARAVTDRGIRPTRVECPHPRTDGLEEFERFFGCPVKFSAPSGLLEFSNETLALPLITQDAYLLEMLRPFCAEAERARNAATGPLRDAVENEVERLLPNGQVKAATVAMALAISVETLSRRLSEEGTSFADVVDQLRQSLALRYLEEPGLTLAQIAWLLGYERPIAFTHAFKRWTGRSPSVVRNENGRHHFTVSSHRHGC